MNTVLFAAPGILGPSVLASLIGKQQQISLLVIASSTHSISSGEIEQLADQFRIPHLKPRDLNSDDFIQYIRHLKPDLILVASFDQKIPRSIYSLAKRGAVNIHPSLLPKYRGACPEFWAIRNGERATGVSVHALSDTFDEGELYLQEEVEITSQDTLGTLLYRLAHASARLALEVIALFAQESFPKGKPQPREGVTAAPLVQSEDLQIDWNQSADEIRNLIRAANPLGGAWTLFRQLQLKIWFAEHYAGAIQIEGEVGTCMILPSEKRLIVKVGDGALSIQAIQYAWNYIADGWNFAMLSGLKAHESFQTHQPAHQTTT